MIDENLSQLSDLAFEGAMAGYLVAHSCATPPSSPRSAWERNIAQSVGARALLV